jgi:hypothetical protein
MAGYDKQEIEDEAKGRGDVELEWTKKSGQMRVRE